MAWWRFCGGGGSLLLLGWLGGGLGGLLGCVLVTFCCFGDCGACWWFLIGFCGCWLVGCGVGVGYGYG